MPNLLVICKTEVHCKTCRDPAAEQFRDDLAKHYDLPPGFPKCPYGKPMGGDGSSELSPRLYPKRIRRDPLPPGVSQHEYEQMKKDGLVN